MNKVQQLREVIKKLVPMIASRGIAVTQMGAQAYVATDKKTLKPIRVNIPHLPDDADERLCLAIQGFIDHELGHVLDTDWAAVAESEKRGATADRARRAKMTPKQAGAFMSQVHNVVEDPYVERKMAERFKGSAYNVDKLHDIFIEKISKPAIDKATTPQDRFGCIFVPLVRAWAGQTKFRDFLADNGYDKDELVVAYSKLVPDEVKARIGKTKNSWETLEIAEILFDIMHPEPPPPPPALPEQSMADAINEEMKDQQEQSDSEKADDPDGEGNNQDKPEDQDDKGADGEQPDEQPSLPGEEGDDGEGDTGEGEQDGKEGQEAEEGSEAQGEADADDEGDTEADQEGDAGGDADNDADEDGDGDSEGGADAGDAKDDGEEDGDSDDQAGGSSGSKADDEDEGDDAGDDDAAGDAEGGSGESAEGDEEGDEDDTGGGKADGEKGDESGDQADDADDGDGNEGSADADGRDDDAAGDDEGEADGEVGSEGDKNDGESRSTGEKADAEDEADTSRNDLEQAPESSPFQGVEIENLGDDMAKGIAFIITNEATREIKGLDYRVYTTEWDVCEKFPVPEGNPELEIYERKGRRYHDRKVTLNTLVTELDERTGHMVAPMQKDIERMMAARSQVLKVPGYRSGRLHSGSLHRLRTGDDRVFRRIEEHKSQETAVTLLIDNSGSMSGEKMQMAMAAGYALSSTLQRVNIKHEVIGFTTMVPRSPKDWAEQQRAEEERIGKSFSRYGALYHPIYKEINERLTPEVKRRFAIAPFRCPMSGNTDGESVRFAGNRLALRQEPRKVLIVLSDGHPAGMSHFSEEIYSDLHKAVEECEKKRIETIGVGIMDDAVKTFYPKNVVLKDLAELPKQVMKELKGILAQ